MSLDFWRARGGRVEGALLDLLAASSASRAAAGAASAGGRSAAAPCAAPAALLHLNTTCLHCLARSGSWLLSLHSWLRVSLLLVLLDTSLRSHRCVSIIGSGFRAMLLVEMIKLWASGFRESAQTPAWTCWTGRRGVRVPFGRLAPSARVSLRLCRTNLAIYVAVAIITAGRERPLGQHGSTRIAAPRARRRNARPLTNFDMLLRSRRA